MKNKILIETSARHIHITKEDYEALFGKGAQLTFKKELSQPGQFQAEERVTIVGPKRELERVSILGPFRKETQVELSATDARSIGVDSVVRLSGDIKGTPGCKIVGPKGSIDIKEGVIVAKRHIHLTEEKAKELGLKQGDVVKVEVKNDTRSLVFGDVEIRVSSTYDNAMHIDTDESNAGSVAFGTLGTIIK